MIPKQVGHTYRIVPEGKHGMAGIWVRNIPEGEAPLWSEVGQWQGHRFGERTSRDGCYLDVLWPSLHWVVRKDGEGGVYFPTVNTWRSAYGLMRRMLGKTSR